MVITMSGQDRKWTDAQTQAMTLRNPRILVSAAAGSGKTSVLTERIIRRLTDPDDPLDLSDLLVVTFTRKAAAELKSKIAKALGDALAKHPGDARLSGQLLELGNARISTIDAFFQQAVRDRFEQLGLPSSFRMADTNELAEVSNDILNDLIEEFYRSYSPDRTEEGAFSRLRENRFADCMDQVFTGRSDGKLNDTLLEFYRKFSSYPDGIALLGAVSEELRQDAERDFLLSRPGRTLANVLREAFSDYAGRMEELEVLIAGDPDIGGKLAGTMADDRAILSSVLAALDGERWEDLQSAIGNAQPGRFPTLRPKPASAVEYHDLRNKCFGKLKDYRDELFAEGPEQLREQLLRTADVAQMLYQLFSAYEERFLAEKKDRGVLEFDDVRNALYRLLTGSDGEESLRQLAGNIREVYVDEYQDVDEIQDRIFRLVGRDHLFLVGDIKQSIYGFRGSDPTIFSRYRQSMPLSTEAGAKDAPAVCVFMSDNFRCDPPIIRFANGVCSFLFSACAETVGYRPQDDLKAGKHLPDGALPAPVRVRVFERGERGEDGEKVDREAKWVAREIRRLMREERLDDGSPIRPSDIAILARGNGPLERYAAELEAIGVHADKSSDLCHTRRMTDLVNLLHAIDNPYRDLPLSEFLLSDLGGFSLEELSAIRDPADPQRSLYDALNDASKKREATLAEKARAFTEWLEFYRRIASVQPADRFLRRLFLDPKLCAYANDPEYLYLYDQARIWQRSSWCGLYGFLKAVDRMREGEPVQAGGFQKKDQSVSLMTIHSSKGLEFSVVFVVSAGTAFSGKSLETPLLYLPRAGFGTVLYDAESASNLSNVTRSAVRNAIRQEETEGEIRLLYVALTRAKERLYVTGTFQGKFENLRKNASAIRRGSRFTILGANNYLQWILAAMLNEPDRAEAEWTCVPAEDPSEEAEETACAPQELKTEPATARSFGMSETEKRFCEVLRASETFHYPLEFLRGIPTKVAASRLRPGLLDQPTVDDDRFVPNEVRLMQDVKPDFDSLIAAYRKPTAAEIGTATHAFLEFCRLEKLPEIGVGAELDRLVREGFMTSETAGIVHLRQLEAFVQSDLMKRILSAKRIYREQKFGLLQPLEELTSDPVLAGSLRGHSIFVQGSIDLILETADGRIELYDYKTDHITAKERADRAFLLANLTALYGSQLACYARAIGKLFGRLPDSCFLYLLPLGDVVEI